MHGPSGSGRHRSRSESPAAIPPMVSSCGLALEGKKSPGRLGIVPTAAGLSRGGVQGLQPPPPAAFPGAAGIAPCQGEENEGKESSPALGRRWAGRGRWSNASRLHKPSPGQGLSRPWDDRKERGKWFWARWRFQHNQGRVRGRLHRAGRGLGGQGVTGEGPGPG